LIDAEDPSISAKPLDLTPGSYSRRRRSNLRDVNVLCWGLFIVFLAVPGFVAMRSQILTAQGLHQVPENDFIYFYGMGQMFNEKPTAQLYNYEAQQQTYTGIHQLKSREYGPNPYHPLIGVLFRPLASLPYIPAYLIWISTSMCLYVGALALFLRRIYPDDLLRCSLIFCFALSFYPFFWIETGGQIAVIGFFGMALAFREDDAQHPFLSGLALSLCIYKPTLLTLVLPMLLITRRYRSLVGFACGGTLSAGFVTIVQGSGVWPGYIKLLLSFGSGAVQAKSFKVLSYYLDLASFSASIPGGRSWPGRIIFLACICAAIFGLFQGWRKSVGAGQSASRMVWAATLTWTLILNIYVPIHDAILVVLSIIATAAVWECLPAKRGYLGFTLLWILILVSSWMTIPLASAIGIQILTVFLTILGILQLFVLRRMSTPLSIATN
jgi:hypothetical protein